MQSLLRNGREGPPHRRARGGERREGPPHRRAREAPRAREIKDNKKHGEGTFTQADGGKYVGQHKDGKRHGEGTFTDKYGEYVGQFKHDEKHGLGKLTNADGAKYVGQWYADRPHVSKYTYADGTVWHDGEWGEDWEPKK